MCGGAPNNININITRLYNYHYYSYIYDYNIMIKLMIAGGSRGQSFAGYIKIYPLRTPLKLLQKATININM